MVSDLLDVSRIETLKLAVDPQHTAVPRLISEVLRTCCANARLKSISLRADNAQVIPAAWADRARVRQVLINLIDNAIGFTPYGGTITVRVQTLEEDHSFLHLSVADTGCGISPENCLAVFRSPGTGKTHRRYQPQRPGPWTLHSKRVGYATRGSHLGRESGRTR
jgi:signal transduction histidine kinase